MAEQDVKAQRQDREDQDFDDERLDEARHACQRAERQRHGGHREGRPNSSNRVRRLQFDCGLGHAHSTCSSSLPHERTSSTTAITPKMMKLARSGSRALPKVSDTPIKRLAQKAPVILPSPPTTTTIRVVISTSKSSPGNIPMIGAPSRPARPASPVPNAKAAVKRKRTL